MSLLVEIEESPEPEHKRELPRFPQHHKGMSRQNLLEEMRVTTGLDVWISQMLDRGSLFKECVQIFYPAPREMPHCER